MKLEFGPEAARLATTLKRHRQTAEKGNLKVSVVSWDAIAVSLNKVTSDYEAQLVAMYATVDARRTELEAEHLEAVAKSERPSTAADALTLWTKLKKEGK